MKKLILTSTILIAVAVVFVIGARAAQGMKEGKWEMRMVIKMDGIGEEYSKAMKEMENMPPAEKAMMQQMMGKMGMGMNVNAEGMTTTVTQCLSSQNPVPPMDKMNNNAKDCKETHSMNGNTVKFEAVCKGSKSSGEMTFDGDSMHGKIKSQQKSDGKDVDATIEMTGKYLGPCSK